MKLMTAMAIASFIENPDPDVIIPLPFSEGVVDQIDEYVKKVLL